MIQEYIRAAMRHAKYEIIEDDGSFYGHIEECPGLWANKKHSKLAVKNSKARWKIGY